jgi:hypothetical protein
LQGTLSNERRAMHRAFRGLASGDTLPGGTLQPLQASKRHGDPSRPAHKLAYICPGEGAQKHPGTHAITCAALPWAFRGLASGDTLPRGTLQPPQASARHGSPSRPAHKLAYICPGEGAQKHQGTHAITRAARYGAFRGLAREAMGEWSMPIAHVPRTLRAGWAFLIVGVILGRGLAVHVRTCFRCSSLFAGNLTTSVKLPLVSHTVP